MYEFDWSSIIPSLPYLLAGLVITLKITVTAVVVGIVWGTILAVMRLSSFALMNPLMILVKIIKLRWIHILSYDQMVSRKINNQTTRCANSIFYTTLFTNSAPNYT
ncbi:hypothetical protein AEU18_12655 [Salmonella enterica subsp. enterica serovar Bredeney]|nr:hypothetical protein AEU18_12655 [Salmonella enterica subsp. enterica serovar Bredeney]